MANAPKSKAEPPSRSTTEMHLLAEATNELASYRKLIDRVVDVFGDEIKASRWLSRPNPELDGETPLQTAERNGYDAQVLEPLLTRIEHGIYI
jgi:uncharacterized protein (DUF2384 family)